MWAQLYTSFEGFFLNVFKSDQSFTIEFFLDKVCMPLGSCRKLTFEAKLLLPGGWHFEVESLVLEGWHLKSSFLFYVERSNWPGEKVVAFCGVEKARTLLLDLSRKGYTFWILVLFVGEKVFFLKKYEKHLCFPWEFGTSWISRNVWVMAICIVVPFTDTLLQSNLTDLIKFRILLWSLWAKVLKTWAWVA